MVSDLTGGGLLGVLGKGKSDKDERSQEDALSKRYICLCCSCTVLLSFCCELLKHEKKKTVTHSINIKILYCKTTSSLRIFSLRNIMSAVKGHDRAEWVYNEIF